MSGAGSASPRTPGGRVFAFAPPQRILVLVAVTLGGVYWSLFAYSAFPWIVPPDHSEDLLRLHTRVAADGLFMIHASMVLAAVSLGLLGRGRWAMGLTALVLAWLIFFPFTTAPRGLSPLDTWRRPVNGAYVALSLFLLASLGADRRRGLRKPPADGCAKADPVRKD